MATYYIDSAAAGAGTGVDWANAYTTVSAALSGKAAGDVFYVASSHSESTASAVTITGPGTAASPCKLISVNKAGSVPPVSADLTTGAVIATTGANNINWQGYWYVYGVTTRAGDSTSNGTIRVADGASAQYFDNCRFELGGSSTSAVINFGNTSNVNKYVYWRNCTVKYSSVSQSMNGSNVVLTWKNTGTAAFDVTTASPAALFNFSQQAVIKCECLDLSSLTSSSIASASAASPTQIFLKDCKLPASFTLAQGTTVGRYDIYTVRSANSSNNYTHAKYNGLGTQTVETTITRTGGASDGTQAISWKIVTNADTEWWMPFESLPISVWNDTSGASKTLTVYGVWGGGAVPNNDDIWIEVTYPGDSGSPLGSLINSTKADILASNAATTSDSSTWGGSTTKFKMSVTFTPQAKGPITVVVKAAAASSTFYIDPKVEIA